MKRLAKSVLAAGLFAATALGAMNLTTNEADAFPQLLCGPTFQWSCTGIGGPSILFIGTVCEAQVFARRNNLVCTPI